MAAFQYIEKQTFWWAYKLQLTSVEALLSVEVCIAKKEITWHFLHS